MRCAALALGLIAVAAALPAANGGTSATLRCFGEPPTVSGLRGTPRNDVIIGTSGNDRIFGLGGNDRICSGNGNDRVNGGPGNDRVDLGPGDDMREQSPGDDLIYGRGGSDRLFGGPGNDRLFGGPGNDILNGGPGMDRGFGEAGADECILIEVIQTCEVETPTGEKILVEISRLFFYHPPGASSSFACITFDGTDGSTYVVVISGQGARAGSDRVSGTLGSGPATGVFDIFQGGPLTFNATLTKDGKSASAQQTLDVPIGPANPGDSSCKK